MPVLDLTLPFPARCRQQDAPAGPQYETTVNRTATWPLPGYHARVHYFEHWGMAGTYLDLPGHIVETDDGRRADTVPADAFYRRPADVIHLDRADGSGGIGVAELAAAAPAGPPAGALILNALGARRFDAIANRSVWLTRAAGQWLIDRGVDLLVSDVYESATEPQGIFPLLFGAGITCVCCPVNLHLLTAPCVHLSALTARIPEATQLPCRLLAEFEEES